MRCVVGALVGYLREVWTSPCVGVVRNHARRCPFLRPRAPGVRLFSPNASMQRPHASAYGPPHARFPGRAQRPLSSQSVRQGRASELFDFPDAPHYANIFSPRAWTVFSEVSASCQLVASEPTAAYLYYLATYSAGRPGGANSSTAHAPPVFRAHMPASCPATVLRLRLQDQFTMVRVPSNELSSTRPSARVKISSGPCAILPCDVLPRVYIKR